MYSQSSWWKANRKSIMILILFRSITGENILEDNDNGNTEDKATTNLGELEDGAYFAHLLNDYTEYETMNAFNKWLRNNDW